MKVRLLTHSYVEPRSKKGDEFDVDEATGARLLARGLAEKVDTAPPYPEGEPSTDWKVSELHAWLEAHDAPEFTGTKAEIVKQIDAWRKGETE